MVTSFAVLVLTFSPILIVVALLELAAWQDRRRSLAVAHQISLTDALARELGAVVAPVVRKPWWGPWQIEIAVPPARPSAVAVIPTVVQRALAFGERMSPGRYRLVLTPRSEPAPALAPARVAGTRRYAGVRS
jgi:hypothetical protein